ncbi:hypothetical protein [Hahella ganghwensis]|uniref:hypothetical protein n=1 Tax=Hahella ganghwensis TaxID=286420 RepID=UPI00036E09E9|nr:hypothetical protein [Hahella ganghwensis]
MAANMNNTINLDHFSLPGAQSQIKASAIPERKHWKVQGHLEQKNRKGQVCTFSRFNLQYLEILTKDQGKQVGDAVVDMSFLQPKAREVKDLKLSMRLLAVLLMTGAVATFFLTDIRPEWLAFPILIGGLTLSLAVRFSTHRYDFLAVGSEVVLFSFQANKPDKEAVKAFVVQLEECIEQARLSLPAGKQLIPIAVTEMRRLYKEGLISEQDYETIKWYLFRN